ncbi:MAG: glutamate-cysteine ligase family protein, partial [Candidatus Woesearchaeota archaeon]
MRLTDIALPKRTAKLPLKRSMSGYETEMFVLDENGKLTSADSLLNRAKKTIPVQKECSKYMLEVACLPAKRLSTTGRYLIDNLEELGELAQKNGNALYPFGTYFGFNRPLFRQKTWYTVQRKILGERNFENAGKCCGFHQHYTLPRGIYDRKTKFINYRQNSKINKSLIDSYNFITAADPVFTTITQSSPFVDASYVAKDARLILYRGGKTLKNPDALYAKQPLFGGLSPYKLTIRDLMSTLRRRHQKWKNLMIANKVDYTKFVN